MQDFNPENWIRIAADSVEKLRRCDVFRVLDCRYAEAVQVKEFIIANRPDLADEVEECWQELRMIACGNA